MDAGEVVNTLAFSGPWSPNTHLMLPNCCSLNDYEQDLVVLYPSRWLDEVEVKVSASDFRREFREKASKHILLSAGDTPGGLVRRYWFAMPEPLATALLPEIPDYAGLIAVQPNPLKKRVVTVKQAPLLPNARKLTDMETINLLRLAHIRYWNGRRRGTVKQANGGPFE